MRTIQTMTISLPPGMVEQFEKVRKIERRTRSELVREALRTYLAGHFPEAAVSKREMAGIRRGRRQIRLGQHMSLEDLTNGLAAPNRKAGRKTAQKVSR